ncbi:MAG: TIGR03619 family F420-dependent LLM class oxidoreductase [Deltaproteobacteria bacterium]|nr:TIGR03619 family F420-dependent LLM class oxidoreductase [Deltaproteobacteria bacterium]
MRARKIRCGFGVSSFGFDSARDWFAYAQQCEAGGVDSLWQTDRLVGADAQLEPMAAMAALAGATERIKFGMNAVVVAYRDPLVLAKECATIDFLSNGRLLPVFGVGFEGDPTWKATGRDPAARGKRSDETLEIMARLWNGESVDFAGAHFTYQGARIAPLPVQKPLPLWIGGHSPAAIRRTARIGTGWLGGLMPPGEVAGVVAAIRAECAKQGRAIDEDHFGATLPFRFGSEDDPMVQRFAARAAQRAGGADSQIVVGKPADLVARIQTYVAGGVSKFVLLPLAQGTRELREQTARAIAEVLPAVENRDASEARSEAESS